MTEDAGALPQPAEERIYGRPCADEYGVVEMRPLLALSRGRDVDGLRARLEELAGFVEAAAAAGATAVAWS